MRPILALSLTIPAAILLATGAAHAQRTAPPATWVGVWLFHEPYHGSYAGTAYRLDASGAVTILAMLDTTVEGRRPRQVGSASRGRVVCRIGARWRAGASPERIIFAGVCSDGRARDMEFTVAPTRVMPLTAGYIPRVLRVGGQRGWERASQWDWELHRCDPNPEGRCVDFERHRRVYLPTEAERDVRVASPP